MQGAALVKQASAVAWQHVNLYGRYEFRKQRSLWMWTKSFGNWLKSGSEPRLHLTSSFQRNNLIDPIL